MFVRLILLFLFRCYDSTQIPVVIMLQCRRLGVVLNAIALAHVLFVMLEKQRTKHDTNLAPKV